MKKIIKNVVVPAVIVAKLCAVDSYEADMAIETPDAMGQTSQIDSLPTDLISKIAGYLDLPDIMRLIGTSSALRSILISEYRIDISNQWYDFDLTSSSDLDEIKSALQRSGIGVGIRENQSYDNKGYDDSGIFVIRRYDDELKKLREALVYPHNITKLKLKTSFVFYSIWKSIAFSNLTHLDLSSTYVGYNTLYDIVKKDPPLICLILSGNLVHRDIGDKGAELIATWPGARNLGYLDLSGNNIEFSGAKALFESPNLTGLQHLGLASNSINSYASGSKKLFAESFSLRKLTYLDLSDNKGDFDLDDLAANLPVLRQLYLRNLRHYRHFVVSNIINLINGDNFPNLEELDLTGVSFWSRPWVPNGRVNYELRESPLNLKKLTLRDNYLRNSALRQFLKHCLLNNLEHLDLSYSDIDDEGIKNLLSASQMLPKLQELHIGNLSQEQTYAITDAGAIMIAESTLLFPNLRILNLLSNFIGDKGMDAIFRSPLLANLTKFCIIFSKSTSNCTY